MYLGAYKSFLLTCHITAHLRCKYDKLSVRINIWKEHIQLGNFPFEDMSNLHSTTGIYFMHPFSKNWYKEGTKVFGKLVCKYKCINIMQTITRRIFITNMHKSLTKFLINFDKVQAGTDVSAPVRSFMEGF